MNVGYRTCAPANLRQRAHSDSLIFERNQDGIDVPDSAWWCLRWQLDPKRSEPHM